MSTEKFCLKWNDFESNISLAFREIREDKDFFDVTLACGEGEQQISAHKVILAACSPFFRNVLRRNPHQHPLLYLKGVTYSDLQSVLSFMYHGEVNVAQEELNGFLSIAEELKVKGLTQGNDGGSSKRPRSPAPSKSSSSLPVKRPRPAPPIPPVQDDPDIQEVVPVKTEPALAAVTSYSEAGASQDQQQQQVATYDEENYAEYGEYEDQQGYTDTGMVDFNQSMDGNKEALMRRVDGGYECILCCKVIKHNNIKRHIQDIHSSDGQSFMCDVCQKYFKNQNSLNVHYYKFHHKEKQNVL